MLYFQVKGFTKSARVCAEETSEESWSKSWQTETNKQTEPGMFLSKYTFDHFLCIWSPYTVLWTGANMRHIRCRSFYYCQYHIHKRGQTRQGDLSLYCFSWAQIPVYKSISDRFPRLEPKMKSTMIFYRIREIDGLDFGVVLPLNIVQY